MFKILSTFKGGGYRYCRTEPPHPKRNSFGAYPLHRVLMENKLGRLLKTGEIVHHKDENKDNDDPENLALMTPATHAQHHHPKVSPVDVECTLCKKVFQLAPRQYRKAKKYNKKGIFCTRSCAGKFRS